MNPIEKTLLYIVHETKENTLLYMNPTQKTDVTMYLHKIHNKYLFQFNKQ